MAAPRHAQPQWPAPEGRDRIPAAKPAAAPERALCGQRLLWLRGRVHLCHLSPDVAPGHLSPDVAPDRPRAGWCRAGLRRLAGGRAGAGGRRAGAPRGTATSAARPDRARAGRRGDDRGRSPGRDRGRARPDGVRDVLHGHHLPAPDSTTGRSRPRVGDQPAPDGLLPRRRAWRLPARPAARPWLGPAGGAVRGFGGAGAGRRASAADAAGRCAAGSSTGRSQAESWPS